MTTWSLECLNEDCDLYQVTKEKLHKVELSLILTNGCKSCKGHTFKVWLTEETEYLYKLVEKAEGPYKGKIWREEYMTDAEAARQNEKIHVMKWEK